MSKPLSFVAQLVSNLLTNSGFKPIEFDGMTPFPQQRIVSLP